MDILRKMFKLNEENAREENDASAKDEFRKPQWFEETETDDELFDDDRKFAFQIFTNPVELQKHFERQMQQIMEAISEFEDGDVKVEKNLKEEFLKPGFEGSLLKEFEKHKKNCVDTDLDGEIYADQLHSLMQRFTTNDEEIPNILPRNDNNKKTLQPKRKLSDEEIIMGKIHGTLADEDDPPARSRMMRPRPDIMTPMTPMPFGGVFEGTYQGPKMFSQSIMTKTIRKPDGTFETTKITKDADGNQTTTITRTINGKSETVTTYNGNKKQQQQEQQLEGGTDKRNAAAGAAVQMRAYSNRNIFVTKEGYAVPLNLW